ncbi:MurR/RpiR family transcriptional regulator [Hoeflea prorocentri]|uniref:MurR/RpiR family transcriptional regulator n=1 Tax=Hoeflea prorocentri TaxID=1922333 RepID=A0A9X3UL02_9HYPH|nr:MurR/RpiR family transcriptional regulator [Hoeflea prorocentri]MCY6383208.1 MurR/RpiR family transcriptional regulator [Hoeflea prorocentri]MDA5401008.1 MurR/RpiR family transcriptional regulator [Hoeflea prorocentri]
MNNINVPNPEYSAPTKVLKNLSAALEELTPETRKAAAYVLENPNDVGVSSIREIAEAARVKPNTFVRMARSVGFEGYDDFREPFREEIRRGVVSFPDRARWLQSLARGGELARLYADMAASAIRNIEETFAATDDTAMKAAADAVVASRRTYVLGVGVNSSNARNFTYLADMAVDTIEAIPRPGSVAIDDLARAGPGDVLIAMTCKPYRSEVVEAVSLARRQGLTVIALSDSPASPIVIGSDHAFIVAADTPQFFPSSVSNIALLEALMAFVIADAAPEVISNIERFHERRHTLGIYQPEE